MTDTRPEFIPVPVWDFWTEYRDHPDWNAPRLTAAARRLMGFDNPRPEVAEAWRNLARVNRSPQDWRLFFELLWRLPDARNETPARKKGAERLKRSRFLAKKVSALAGDLAGALDDYRSLAEQDRLACPAEALLPELWIEETARRYGDLDRYREHCAPGFVTGSALGVKTEHLPDPAAMIETLGDLFAELEPAHRSPTGDTRQQSQKAPWVREFDAALSRLHRRCMVTPPFEITPEDTARVTSQKLMASPTRPAPARGSGRATAEPSRSV